jgi:hypothetical protein
MLRSAGHKRVSKNTTEGTFRRPYECRSHHNTSRALHFVNNLGVEQETVAQASENFFIYIMMIASSAQTTVWGWSRR